MTDTCTVASLWFYPLKGDAGHTFFFSLPGLLLPCRPYLWWRLAVSFSGGDTLHWCESIDRWLEHWSGEPHHRISTLCLPSSMCFLSLLQVLLSCLVCIACIFICKERANVSSGIISVIRAEPSVSEIASPKVEIGLRIEMNGPLQESIHTLR